MKVIHVIGGGEFGGAEQHIIQLLTLLKQRGVQPKVVCFYDLEFAEQLRVNNIDVEVLNFGRFDIRLLGALEQLFTNEQPDIIHTHGVKANFFVRIAVRNLRHIPTVTTVHSVLRFDYGATAYKFVRKMEDVTRRYNDYYIAVSNAIMQSLLKEDVNPEQIAVVYHGMDTKKFKPQLAGNPDDRNRLRAEWNIPSGAYVIGVVGRMVPIKGLDEALQAFKLISWEIPHAHFVFVGSGPQENELKALAHKYGLTNKIQFVGFRLDVDACMRTFECFVSASHSEGLGLNIMEAMATGLPVVVTGVGGVLDFVKHEQNGLIVPPHDPASIAEEVIRLIKDRDFGDQLGAAARNFVIRRFSMALMADNTIHAYSRLLQIRRSISSGLANNNAQRIVISGYYGYGNSGDEALLESILLALREESTKLGIYIVPIVLSIRPQATEMMHGVKAIHRMNVFQIARELKNADGLISGGGSLLQDATGTMTIPYYLIMIKIAQWLNKPTFIYSQGVGPITKRIFYPLIKHVYSRAQYISVRDEPSANLLKEIGLPAERVQLVSDPVMGLPLTPAEERSTHARRPIESEVEASDMPIIGVSVRYWEQKREDLNGIAGALAHLLKTRAVRIRLLPFHIPNDIKASRHILARLEQMCSKGEMANIELVLDAVQPQDMLREIQACNILIGMRLHSLIYAAANRIPMLGISYDPKIDHFLEQIGLEVAAHSHNVDPEQLAEQAFLLLETGKEMMDARAERIEQLQHTANIPAQQIADILRVSSIVKAERNKMETINLYGIEVSRRTLQQTADTLQQAIATKQPTQVVTVNPIMMMEGFRSEPYMNMLRNAEMVIPDGTGVVWAAKHFGTPVQERVAGFDLFQELMRRGKDLGWKVYLLGSSPEVVQATAENLQIMYPGIQIVGVQDGFFTGEDDQLIVADIKEKQPDILLVARSMALQDPWIEYYKKQLQVSVMMGVGGSFDVISGKSKRAPQIFIKFHAEWLYRLLKEPWRAKRMLALPQFVLKVLSTRK